MAKEKKDKHVAGTTPAATKSKPKKAAAAAATKVTGLGTKLAAAAKTRVAPTEAEKKKRADAKKLAKDAEAKKKTQEADKTARAANDVVSTDALDATRKSGFESMKAPDTMRSFWNANRALKEHIAKNPGEAARWEDRSQTWRGLYDEALTSATNSKTLSNDLRGRIERNMALQNLPASVVAAMPDRSPVPSKSAQVKVDTNATGLAGLMEPQIREDLSKIRKNNKRFKL